MYDIYTNFMNSKKDAVMEETDQPINQPDSIEDNLLTAEENKVRPTEEVKSAHA